MEGANVWRVELAAPITGSAAAALSSYGDLAVPTAVLVIDNILEFCGKGAVALYVPAEMEDGNEAGIFCPGRFLLGEVSTVKSVKVLRI